MLITGRINAASLANAASIVVPSRDSFSDLIKKRSKGIPLNVEQLKHRLRASSNRTIAQAMARGALSTRASTCADELKSLFMEVYMRKHRRELPAPTRREAALAYRQALESDVKKSKSSGNYALDYYGT